MTVVYFFNKQNGVGIYGIFKIKLLQNEHILQPYIKFHNYVHFVVCTECKRERYDIWIDVLQ